MSGWQRPDDCKRIHFGCNGTIMLTQYIPAGMVRVGDTASGALPGPGPHVVWLWRCTAVVERISEWEPIEQWTPVLGRRYVAEADVYLPIIGPEPKPRARA